MIFVAAPLLLVRERRQATVDSPTQPTGSTDASRIRTVIGAGVSMDMDVSILSLSTVKSLLPHNCTIPHVPQGASLDISSALSPATGEPALSGLRAYLAVSRVP